MRKTVKMNGSVEASTCASQGRQSRSTQRWSTAFLAVALGLATLGASASFVASTLQADEPREWKGRFGATVATGTLDLERTDAELVAANAADADVTKPKTVYFRDESGKLVKYNYAWLSPADRAEVDFALGLAAATVEETDADETAEVAWNAAPKAGTRKVLTVNGVEYAFRYCPAGTFTMGSPESERAGLENVDNEAPQHEVTLTRGFWMLETEVTQAMYEALTGANPSWFSASGDGSDAVAGLDTSRFPVEMVIWEDAQKFVKALNDGGFAPEGFVFRLPTEAEWEYACRAGTSTAYSWGSSLNGDQANCNGNFPYGTSTKGEFLMRTTAVGSYEANAWGLYDMHGNVCEWCSDWYGSYVSGAQTDPTGLKWGSYRVLRGGSWGRYAEYCRSARRLNRDPMRRYIDGGFRFVLGYSDNALDAGNNTVAQDSKKVSISGVVTVDGEPVDKGSIRFKPADGQGPTDDAQIVDGKFEAEVSTGEKILVVDGVKVDGQYEPDPTFNPGLCADKLEMYPGMPFKQEKKISVKKKGQIFEIDYVTAEAE
ncbi:MAG: formylglycine-generating enzyme family protein [Thermoguttaceae bacterium]|nr:formylglycine-generating enzyme family protein [Thermoguttaceae bacterium]